MNSVTAPADRFVCVVLHDVAPSTRAACSRVLKAISEVAELPLTLLAVPNYHGDAPDRDFDAWLGQRLKRGDELALHGYTHRDDLPAKGWLDRLRRNHYTRGEGEFWALPEAEAKERVDAGRAWFGANDWPLHGFVAPAWLLGAQAWPALKGFEYTMTLRQIVRLPGRDAVTSQSVVYSTSSGWRRRTSLLWNAVVARKERSNALLRIELHPRDADFKSVRRSWQAILERALRDRRVSTVAEFVRQSSRLGAAPSTFWQTTRAD
ncbi:MAG: polysaccharide deacetylase family protein [Pseudomonadota bacterium]|nr:polysaccharide deacetylase family protein [Pseudomonadota bacterium]